MHALKESHAVADSPILPALRDQLAVMAELRRQILSGLSDSAEDDVIEAQIAEHAGRLAWVLDAMNAAPLLYGDQALQDSLRAAQAEMDQICAMIAIQLKLLGNDMHRAYELRRSLGAYRQQFDERMNSAAPAGLLG